jgi:hypothetical protein
MGTTLKFVGLEKEIRLRGDFQPHRKEDRGPDAS